MSKLIIFIALAIASNYHGGLCEAAEGVPSGRKSVPSASTGGIPDTKGATGGIPDTKGAAGGIPDPGNAAGGVPDPGTIPDTNTATNLTSGAGIPGTNGSIPSLASCFANKPTPVSKLDEKWVLDFGKKGLYNRISYKLSGWGTALQQPDPPKLTEGKKPKHKVCWDVQMKTPIGVIDEADDTRTTCVYDDDVAKEQCALETNKADFVGAFKHWGDFHVIKYKNDVQNPKKSYMLVYVCLLGKENFFLTLMLTDKKTPLDKSFKDMIVAEVKKWGFNEKDIVYDADATLAIDKIQVGTCPGESPIDFSSFDKIFEGFSNLFGSKKKKTSN